MLCNPGVVGSQPSARTVWLRPPVLSSPKLPSPFRLVARLPDLIWTLFLVWTAIGFVVMPLGIGEVEIRRWLGAGLIRAALLAILHVSDALWIGLAATVVYFHTVAAEGLPTARRWAVIILCTAGGAEWLGTRTGFPFGPYRYTANFGWLIGGVLPVAIPLAWFVIVLCARVLVRQLRPGTTRLELALGVGFVAFLTDLNLEFIAWKVRGYWRWYPDLPGPLPSYPPFQNFVAWFLLSFALALFLPGNHTLRLRRPSAFRPLVVLGLMNTLFLVVHLARWWLVRG